MMHRGRFDCDGCSRVVMFSGAIMKLLSAPEGWMTLHVPGLPARAWSVWVCSLGCAEASAGFWAGVLRGLS